MLHMAPATTFDKKIDIRTPLPGPEAQRIIKEERQYLSAGGTKCWETPAVPKAGSGVWFQDIDGNTLMDWTNGMVVILGHNHPDWKTMVEAQLEKLVYFNAPDFPHPTQAILAREICDMTPGSHAKRVFFSCSGTEANEAAYKIARQSTKRNLIISFVGGFHGRTTGTLATTTSKAIHRRGYTQYLNNTFQIPYGHCYRCWYNLKHPSCAMHCAEILERYLQTVTPAEDVAAIVAEPMQGEGGYVVPPPEFFPTIKRIADKHGILLIADEVQTCFGKSGTWFASDQVNFQPDIVTMAKGLSNGMALGATVFPAALDFPQQGMHSNTFGGQTLACASSLATIAVIRKDHLLDKVKEAGRYFRERLLALQEACPSIGDVRTLGLLIGVEFVRDRTTKEPAKDLRDAVLQVCYQKGVLLLGCGESAIRITPAYTISRDEIDLGLSVLTQAIRESEKAFGIAKG